MMRHRHPANVELHDNQDAVQRYVGQVLKEFGSLRFIVIQTVIVAGWIVLNVVAFVARWDPYPFILLNLAFSTQAAYAAPLILLSQNRQAEHDRLAAEHDFAVNAETLDLLKRLHDEHGAMLRQLTDSGSRS
jgi:uncharacterized membrane protein